MVKLAWETIDYSKNTIKMTKETNPGYEVLCAIRRLMI